MPWMYEVAKSQTVEGEGVESVGGVVGVQETTG